MKVKYKLIALSTALILTFSILFAAVGAADLIMGDANLDGKITSADARLTLRIAAKLYTDYSDDVFTVCDVNGDDKVNSTDGRMIMLVSARIYDKSIFFNKLTKDEIVLRTTKKTVTERDPVQWDDILYESTALRTTKPAATTAKPVHPNNIYTTRAPATAAPGTVPAVSATGDITTVLSTDVAPTEEQPSQVIPTEPVGEITSDPSLSEAVPTTSAVDRPPATDIIYTGTPGKPGGEKTTFETAASTTEPTVPPTTADPNAPVFKLVKTAASGDLVSFALYSQNAAGVKQGILSVGYDSALLEFDSFVKNDQIGAVDCREVATDELGCMFALDHASGNEVCFGTVTFRIVDPQHTGTTLSLSVREHYNYNWVGASGKPIAQPADGAYYLVLNAN